MEYLKRWEFWLAVVVVLIAYHFIITYVGGKASLSGGVSVA